MARVRGCRPIHFASVMPPPWSTWLVYLPSPPAKTSCLGRLARSSLDLSLTLSGGGPLNAHPYPVTECPCHPASLSDRLVGMFIGRLTGWLNTWLNAYPLRALQLRVAPAV